MCDWENQGCGQGHRKKGWGNKRGYSEVPDVYSKDMMTAGSGHGVQSEATGTSELEGGKAEMPGLPQTAHVAGG